MSVEQAGIEFPAEASTTGAGDAARRARDAGFRTLFAAHPQPMWVIDRDTLVFLEVNEAAVELYGFSHDEFLRMTVFALRPAEDAVSHRHDGSAQVGFLEPGEACHQLKDRVIRVRVDTRDLDFAGRAARLCTITDITARAGTYHRSEYLAEIVESSQDAVTARDREGRFTVWNPAAERLYGYAASEVLGSKATFLEPPDRAGEVADIVRRVFAGERIRLETVRLTKSGRPVDVVVFAFPVSDRRGRVVGMASLHRDVGEHKQRQEEIQRLISILDATTDFVGSADPDGNILYLNRGARRMLGLGEDEDITGRKIAQDHPSWDLPRVLAGLGAALADGAWEGESVMRSADGSETPTSQVILAHKGHDGRVRFFSTVARDVTQRRQAQTALLDRTHQLATLLDISYNVASVLELEPLLGLILDQLRTVVHYSAAAVLVLEGETLAVQEYRGDLPRDEVLRLRFQRHEVPAYETVLRTGVPIVEADLADPTREHACDTCCLRGAWPDARSWLGVPLRVKGRTIGLFCIEHSEPAQFSEHDAELTLAIANHAALAIENARLFEQAHQLAVVEERQRLGRELHDSVAQALFGVGLGAHAALPLIDSDPAGAKRAIEEIRSLSETGLAEMRALIFELRPESLETEGLIAALSRQGELIGLKHGIRLDLQLGPEPSVSLNAKEALYRIALEALRNTVKHAQAREMRITLEQTGDEVILEVSDDGAGFDPSASFPGHFGLVSMRERATQLGGTAEIRSAPGRGAIVRACVPLAGAEA